MAETQGRRIPGYIIGLLLNQSDQHLPPVVEELLKGDGEQRMAGLDILLQLKKADRKLAGSTGWVETFRTRKVTPKEEILLDQISESGAIKDVSAANGYGLYDPAQCAQVIDPVIDKECIYERLLAQQPFALSMPISKVKEAFKALDGLLEQHRGYEYEVDGYNNTVKPYC